MKKIQYLIDKYKNKIKELDKNFEYLKEIVESRKSFDYLEESLSYEWYQGKIQSYYEIIEDFENLLKNEK